MRNPTIVVLADRNDLHNQLFVRFSRFHDLLRQSVMEAESRAHLRRLPLVQAGGVILTTLQRFFPENRGDLHPAHSERRNIVVIVGEAHRSRYDLINACARQCRTRCSRLAHWLLWHLDLAGQREHPCRVRRLWPHL